MSVLIPTRRIDWWQVIVDIERSGLSQREIASQVGYESHASVNQLKNDPGRNEPRFHFGAMLLALWFERTGRNEAPLVRTRTKL